MTQVHNIKSISDRKLSHTRAQKRFTVLPVNELLAINLNRDLTAHYSGDDTKPLSTQYSCTNDRAVNVLLFRATKLEYCSNTLTYKMHKNNSI